MHTVTVRMVKVGMGRMDVIQRFTGRFQSLTATTDGAGFAPYPWQIRLFERMVAGHLPDALDIPTGLGKTSVMTIWLLARLENPNLPRRLVYVVDRRAVVDQATDEAERLAQRLAEHPDLCAALRLDPAAALTKRDGRRLALPVSTLRGQFADNRKWSENPAHPAIVVGTVDMIGSRLLFNGYRLSRRQWPVHAGLLAHDSLIVLDEAHLNAPFEGLLKDMTEMGRRAPGLPPVSRTLSLSATGAATDRRNPMTIEADDLAHPHVRRLLKAPKPLALRQPDGRRLPERLADEAWALAAPKNGPARRVLVFCNRREDAGKTAELLRRKLAEYGRTYTANRQDYTTSHLNLLVGERRVHERQALRDKDLYKLFLGQPVGAGFDTDAPAFLVATSAGEVGVDLDAQAMVCDLAPWERMAQRLGRVNRRGSDIAAPIIVIDTPDETDPERGKACRSLLSQLPECADGARDASVGAVRDLKTTAAGTIRRASTSFPLRPQLSLPIVEGWALTSLQQTHTGSPDIAPWLRGWEKEEKPQCEVFWRRFIPWRDHEARPDVKVLDHYFDAAPPHLSEMLEAPVWRVMDVLKKQFKTAPVVYAALQKRCVLLLDKRGKLLNQWTHTAFIDLLNDSRKRGNFERDLAGRRLLLQADIGGLDASGLLEDHDAPPPTLDGAAGKDAARQDEAGSWAADLGLEFMIGNPEAMEDKTSEAKARCLAEFRFAFARLDDEKSEILWVKRAPSPDDANENTAISRHDQTLDEHHRWAALMAADMAEKLNLPAELADMLCRSVAVHDAGKAHPDWQVGVGAPQDGKIYAKTTGTGIRKNNNGYRHELGSVIDPAVQAALEHLPENLRDLALHLIVAHHGHARPCINPYVPRGAPSSRAPSQMPEAILDIAVRFARLQKAWGPWGLSWWEAVFRAADGRASFWNDNREGRPACLTLEGAEP